MEETSPDADAGLVTRLQSGDPSAFEEMVRLHMPRLFHVARRMLDSEEDARDAVQDAFLAAFRSVGTFESHAKLSTWLHRIVVNASLMKLRTRRRKPEEDIEQFLPRFHEDGHQTETNLAWNETAESLLERREMGDMVRTAIHRLPETYRVVLQLRDIEELSTDEAAALLGVSANAVKIRLHRARQALRAILDPIVRGVDPPVV